MSEVDRVFSLVFGPQTGIHDRSLAQAAKEVGARQIVKLSALGASGGARTRVAIWHEAGEKAMRRGPYNFRGRPNLRAAQVQDTLVQTLPELRLRHDRAVASEARQLHLKISSWWHHTR
jgi:hypothetical protein